MRESTVTGVVPTISSGNSAILPNNNNNDSTILPKIGCAKVTSAFGFPSTQRMCHWNSKGKMTSSPISQLAEGTLSLLEHSLEQHKEFRRLQSLEIEQQIEKKLIDDRMKSMLKSIKSGTGLNEFNHSGIPTIGGSISLCFENNDHPTSDTTNTHPINDTIEPNHSSLSHPKGSRPKEKYTLASSFRPRSAATAAKRKNRSVVHNSYYQCYMDDGEKQLPTNGIYINSVPSF
jgi:hypothetical protein